MTDHPATDEHRRICSACRLEATVEASLEPEMAPAMGDDLLVARLAGKTSAGAKTRRRRTRVFVLLAAAALIVISGIASGYYTGVIPRRGAQAPATPTEMDSVRDRETPTGRAVAAPPLLPVATPITETETPQPTATSVASIAVPVRSAADIFAEANQARKDGDIDRSIVLYRELTHSHPKSGEAATSHVTLARILFMRNDARSALTEYDAYLDDAKNTTLREEALAGRAKCLEQLGPRDQEKRTWQMLLDEYPQSLHADHARKRLGN